MSGPHPYSAVAIIPARGGSKGVPGKNIRPVAGRPLIAYAIEAASKANTVSRVIVSTDDAEIGAVAADLGAEVVWRPAELAGDNSPSEAALIHVLEEMNREGGPLPELVVFVQCTSPLTIPADVDGTVSALLEADADTAFTVAPFHGFIWRRDSSGEMFGANHDGRVRLMRQQRPQEFMETGAVYAMRTKGLLENRFRFFGRTVMYMTPRDRLLEIDTPDDLRDAEQRLGRRAAMQPERSE